MRLVGTIAKLLAPSHVGLKSWNSAPVVYERNTHRIVEVVDFFRMLVCAKMMEMLNEL